MSKGARVFLVITIVWLALWGGGSALFFIGAASEEAKAGQWGLPATGLVRGADVRFEGIVDGKQPVTAPLSQKQCAAARTHVHYETAYNDAQNKRVQASARIATRLSPTAVGILVGNERVDLPVELWQPPPAKSADVHQAFPVLPPHLAVPADVLATVKANSRGELTGFSVDEWLLTAGDRVFIVAHLEESDGQLRLAPHSELQRLDLYRGSQADGVKDLAGGTLGLRIAGGIFVVLAVSPLLAFAIVQLRKRRARGSA